MEKTIQKTNAKPTAKKIAVTKNKSINVAPANGVGEGINMTTILEKIE